MRNRNFDIRRVRLLISTLANFGVTRRIRRLVDRQAGAALTGWAGLALHISQAGARRPLYPSWAAMITSADGSSRASPDFPHTPVPLDVTKLRCVELFSGECLAKPRPNWPKSSGELMRLSVPRA